MKNIALIVGARPNFMKAAPLYAALQRRGVQPFLIHTGQHYDPIMSKVFFDELGLPQPDTNLEVGGKSADEQKKKIKEKLSVLFKEHAFDGVVVVGDVTSTLAGAEAAQEAGIAVAHVEAGLRSRNSAMPEEYNRIETDKISSFLFTTEPDAEKNLHDEGVKGSIYAVGNVMIDTLQKFLPDAEKSTVMERLHLEPHEFALITLHRAENVDLNLGVALETIHDSLHGVMEMVFPLHPRTRAALLHAWGEKDFKVWSERLHMIEPLGYIDFLALMKNAKVVLTDSGGIQEETTAMGVPCLTLRNETERPITVEKGTNEVVGLDAVKIKESLKKIVDGTWKHGAVPTLWDGHAAERIADILLS
ncbi:MAG: UDP-N-acetylglucosamine 2-epimerase (non-hydrolyzing) [Patescibacteria group bacterium]